MHRGIRQQLGGNIRSLGEGREDERQTLRGKNIQRFHACTTDCFQQHSVTTQFQQHSVTTQYIRCVMHKQCTVLGVLHVHVHSGMQGRSQT